ncbi:hypothetical protein [Odoribacter laneus]|uniref:hypothetical protein n=1 Tax=Odoribacter laneus TaxID=626933 RepID=UPI003FEFDBD3
MKMKFVTLLAVLGLLLIAAPSFFWLYVNLSGVNFEDKWPIVSAIGNAVGAIGALLIIPFFISLFLKQK